MKSSNECKSCGNPCQQKEHNGMLLLVCMNQHCSNYWEREGSEILMLLR